MLQALREMEGGIQLSLNVAARLPHLRRAPILESFLRQVYFTGVTAAAGVIPRACGLGVIIIAVMINMLDADVDLAVKILLLLVFREVGPLAAAIVVILRTGTALCAISASTSTTISCCLASRAACSPRWPSPSMCSSSRCSAAWS